MSIASVNDYVMEKHCWYPRVPQGYSKDVTLHTDFGFHYAYLDDILIASLWRKRTPFFWINKKIFVGGVVIEFGITPSTERKIVSPVEHGGKSDFT